jgi:hypothetical protein
MGVAVDGPVNVQIRLPPRGYIQADMHAAANQPPDLATSRINNTAAPLVPAPTPSIFGPTSSMFGPASSMLSPASQDPPCRSSRRRNAGVPTEFEIPTQAPASQLSASPSAVAQRTGSNRPWKGFQPDAPAAAPSQPLQYNSGIFSVDPVVGLAPSSVRAPTIASSPASTSGM